MATNRGRWALSAAVPLTFAIGYGALAATFNYPEVLKQPAHDTLAQFSAKQASILPWWWAMFASALAFAPLSVLVVRWARVPGDSAVVASVAGVLAGLVQAIGLSRWVFAVPALAASSDPSRVLLFDVLNRWIGGGIGEWLGYLLTAIWTGVIAASSRRMPIRVPGLLIALGIGFGITEAWGLSAAGPINAIAYTLWIPWLIAVTHRVSNPDTKF